MKKHVVAATPTPLNVHKQTNLRLYKVPVPLIVPFSIHTTIRWQNATTKKAPPLFQTKLRHRFVHIAPRN